MKKIAFILPSPFTYGGEQRVLARITNLLANENYNVSIIYMTSEAKVDYNMYGLNKKVKCIYVPEVKNIFERAIRKFHNILKKINNKTGVFKNATFIMEHYYSISFFKKRLIKKINEEKFDYVIGSSSDCTAIVGIISDKITAKTIGWQHNNYKAYFKINRRFCYEEKMLKKIFPKFDNYVVLMNDDKKKIIETFNIKCTHIFNPNSFDTTGKCNLDNHLFIAYGRLDVNKGYELLLESYSKYKKMGGTWKLQIVGDGVEKGNILNDIEKRNLQNDIKMYGFTNHIEKYLEKSSVLLFPSRWEGCSMVFNEGLQFGLPILAYDLNNFVEITNGYDSAILVPQFDTEEFAKKMFELEHNPKLLKHMSKEAYRNLEVLKDDVIVDKWKKILK